MAIKPKENICEAHFAQSAETKTVKEGASLEQYVRAIIEVNKPESRESLEEVMKREPFGLGIE